MNERINALMKQAAALGVPMRDRRLGVGKRMGTSLWVHALYRDVLPTPHLTEAESTIPDNHHWNVVKWDCATGNLSFIDYTDFDDVDEPTTGDSWVWRPDSTCRMVRRLADPWILHHPWNLVRDDYTGFNMTTSIERSILWKTAFGTNAALSSRIGRRSVWLAECALRLSTPASLSVLESPPTTTRSPR